MAQKQENPTSSEKKSARPVPNDRSVSKNTSDKRRRRRRQKNLRVAGCIVLLLAVLAAGWMIRRRIQDKKEQQQRQLAIAENVDSGPEKWQEEGAPYIDVQLLTPNEYSRPQLALESVRYIAIHYTANPGASAIDNRNYFENLSQTHETKVSSHFVVGLEGEVIQCIPTSEMSYATNSRNIDTLSIECCHPDETGVFNDATYDSVVKLTAWLCTRFGLTAEEVIRHYDVTGKECPKYYVDYPEAWQQMKEDIAARIQEDYVLQENLS